MNADAKRVYLVKIDRQWDYKCGDTTIVGIYQDRDLAEQHAAQIENDFVKYKTDPVFKQNHLFYYCDYKEVNVEEHPILPGVPLYEQ